jgi:adenylate kinase
MGRLFVFMGPPGAGKGSLAQFCVQRFGWKQLSTGALCRKHIAEQTEVGRQIDFAIKSGKLVSDDLITSLVEGWLLDEVRDYKPIILDGFPRTVKQAELLTEALYTRLTQCNLTVVNLTIRDELAIQRIGGRTICQNKDCQTVYSTLTESSLTPKKPTECDKCSGTLIKRADDEHSSLAERLQVYYAEAQQLVNFYIQRGISMITLDVERIPGQIYTDFEQLVGRAHDYHKK